MEIRSVEPDAHVAHWGAITDTAVATDLTAGCHTLQLDDATIRFVEQEQGRYDGLAASMSP